MLEGFAEKLVIEQTFGSITLLLTLKLMTKDPCVAQPGAIDPIESPPSSISEPSCPPSNGVRV